VSPLEHAGIAVREILRGLLVDQRRRSAAYSFGHQRSTETSHEFRVGVEAGAVLERQLLGLDEQVEVVRLPKPIEATSKPRGC
jgi:hypothetical protein